MPKNKTIGVIQLGKNNDVLETLIAFKGYNRSFPDIHKTIILKDSAKILETLIREEFEEIVYVSDLDKTSVEKNLKYLEEKILILSFSVLINLTYTKPSSYLCTLIDAKFKLGFKYSKTNCLNIEDSWSKYIYAVIMGKNSNPFSIVDIYKSIIGNKKKTIEVLAPKVEKLILNTSSPVCREGLLLICHNFPHLEIIAIGSLDLFEKKPNLRFINSVDDFLSLNISNALYVGNYSVYSLLCSYRNIPTINLYPSEMDPCLYMPYGHEGLSCLETISPTTLIETIRNKNNETALKTQEGNGYFLYNFPLNSISYDIQEIFLQFYKYAFVLCFEDLEENISIPSVTEQDLVELDKYKKAAETLKDLTLFGKKYSIYIIQELSKERLEVEKIKEYGERLDEIDSLSTRLKKNYPLLGPAIDYFFHSKALVQGENLLEITQNIFFIYEEYSTFLEIILELINNMKSRFTIIEKGN